jgi:putative ABC transport system permease protein
MSTVRRSLLTAARNLSRHRLRSALAVLGIAVTAALLLDMVMLSGGIERSFARMLLGRGFQIRLAPKGTLPFDTEATIPEMRTLNAALQREPGIEIVAPILGTSLHARRGDSLVTLFGYGIDPGAQAMYQLEGGRDLEPGDSAGVLLSQAAARVVGAATGDTITLVGQLDPQIAAPAVERRLVVRGQVRWLYDYQGQASIGTLLPVMQDFARQRATDRVSAVAIRVRDGFSVAAVAERIRADMPSLEVNSVEDLVAQFRQRLVYFRQLSYILGTISLVVTVLLIATLLTITVNERLGEIATLRAIGVQRTGVVLLMVSEGAILALMGTVLGIGLGLVTARYLDRILTSFPGLPAAISFFVPETASLATAATVLLLSGLLAGAYPAWLAARTPIAETLRSEAT